MQPASHMAPRAPRYRGNSVSGCCCAAQSVGQIIRAGFAAIFAARVKEAGREGWREGCRNDEIYS